MTEHNLFYYPYASFTNAQLPLLKVAALYFDKLYILDPEKASGGTVGIGDVAKDVALLEQEGILVRISPEEVLVKYEQEIAAAIRADLNDREFIELCEKSGKAEVWTLALAKVPKEIREDPQHTEYSRRKPQDTAMQQLMGKLPQTVAGGPLRYREIYAEATHRLTGGEFVYDEQRQNRGREIEYRYADYPLPFGESIMVNHALYGGLLQSGATPLTDDSFHNQILNLKIKRARELPAINKAINARAAKQNLLALTALGDKQLGLPVLSPKLALEGILEYRQDNAGELARARDRLGWLARRIREEPWTKEFEQELDHNTIPDIAGELEDAKKSRDSWLKSQRGRSALTAAGVVVGAAAAVLAFFATPLTPVALATAGLGIATGAVIPGTEWLLDWRDGKKSAQENGLHYLLSL